MRISKQRIIIAFMLVSLVIVMASVMFTNNLAGKLAVEEKKKIEIWAEATRQLIMADDDTDLDFVSSIIEGNTTIPVYMTDAEGNVILSRNVREPRQKSAVEAFYKKKIKKLRETEQPIVVRISDDIVQYIYYEDSIVLRQLQMFPFVQFAVIFAVMLIVLIAMQIVQKSEQNMVWVGLSKETAHQLGTPISSLNGWLELLRMNYPEEQMLDHMQVDVDRLQTIAERFSKVGSLPELDEVSVLSVVSDTIDYMSHRTSNKVSIGLHATDDVMVQANKPLLSWVIENLLRNAVDAMSGEGRIDVDVVSSDNKVYIDITDNGRGIERQKQQHIFQPGYTTKERGWGLGLSLSKRIIDSYHHGKLTLKHSQVGEGSCFRIALPKA